MLVVVVVTIMVIGVAVGGVVVTTTNIFGLDLNPEQVHNIVLIGGAWIVGDSLRSS